MCLSEWIYAPNWSTLFFNLFNCISKWFGIQHFQATGTKHIYLDCDTCAHDHLCRSIDRSIDRSIGRPVDAIEIRLVSGSFVSVSYAAMVNWCLLCVCVRTIHLRLFANSFNRPFIGQFAFLLTHSFNAWWFMNNETTIEELREVKKKYNTNRRNK